MAGELWREQVQIGKETTAGTPVAATRIAYLNSVQFTRQRNPNLHKFATGTRDNTRAYTAGPVMAGGQFKLPVSADELVEWLLLGMHGSVTPTTPSGATNARLWTFTPGTSLDSATLERYDGANYFQLTGTRASKIDIQGSTGGANDCTVDLFAQNRIDTWSGPLTGSLSSRTPTFMEGWQSRLWIAPFGGGVAGTTTGVLLPPCMINWQVTFDGALGRKYTAANTLSAASVTLGELAITAKINLEASVASTLTELQNWSGTSYVGRLLTLEFLGPTGDSDMDAGTNAVQTVSITGTPTGGTFALSFAGQTTAGIAYNASAANVATALNALSNVTTQSGNTNIACTGGPLPGSSVTVTFQNDLGTQIVPLMTAASGGLTGGSSPTASVANTTPGVNGRRFVRIDLPGYWTTPDANQADANTRVYSFPLSYVYDPTNAFGIQVRVQNPRTSAY